MTNNATSGYIRQKTVWWTLVYLGLIATAIHYHGQWGGVLVFAGICAATVKEYDRFPSENDD